MALSHKAASSTERPPSDREQTVAIRRAAVRAENTRAARAALVEALIALAEEELSRGHEAATIAALAEAGKLFPKRVPEEPAWRGRFVMLNRMKAALAQKQDRQADAVEAFEAALSVIPAEPASASRDDNAARLQLLVRLARSRLALGEPTTVEAEMKECARLIAALDGQIPPRALDTVRAAILGHTGVARAMLGDNKTAEAKLAESMAVIDKLASPDLADLRRQVLNAWGNVLRQGGGDANALLARTAPADHAHGESCGCGDPHPHDPATCGAHDHHHDHRADHHHDHGSAERPTPTR